MLFLFLMYKRFSRYATIDNEDKYLISSKNGIQL